MFNFVYMNWNSFVKIELLILQLEVIYRRKKWCSMLFVSKQSHLMARSLVLLVSVRRLALIYIYIISPSLCFVSRWSDELVQVSPMIFDFFFLLVIIIFCFWNFDVFDLNDWSDVWNLCGSSMILYWCDLFLHCIVILPGQLISASGSGVVCEFR